VLVAHDASGPPAIDWALAHPGRVQTLSCSTPTTTGPPRCAGHPRLPSTPLRSSAPPPALSSGGGPTWTGACTPGRSASSSSTPDCVPSSSRSCMSSSCPPGRRSGASTTTCSGRCSPGGGASPTCAASGRRSR
jgi:hypothetical protein